MCIVNSPFVYNSYGSSYFLCVSLTPPFVFNSSASSYFLCVLLSIHSHYYKDVSADVVQNPCKPNYCKLRVAYTILITVPKALACKKKVMGKRALAAGHPPDRYMEVGIQL